MPLYASRPIFNAPAVGQQHAVLGDLYREHSKFGKDQFVFDWVLADGKRFKTWANDTLGEAFGNRPSTLRKMMLELLGKVPGYDFDFESLLGVNAILTFVPAKPGAKIPVQVAAFAPLPAGTAKITVPTGFQRHKPAERPSAPPLDVSDDDFVESPVRQ